MHELDLPGRLTADLLVAHLAERLGRTIRLQVLPGLSELGLCGMWIPADASGIDHLFIDAAAASSPAQRLHTTAHELWHIVGGHTPTLTPEGILLELLAESYPSLPRSVLLSGLLGRSGLNSPQERDAEAFATAVMAHTARAADRPASRTGRAALDAFGDPVQRTPYV
ncbi:hypothetical protein [Planobispora rosea]|uniref:hypothetical protein n=1 Tax=Planobispora rosea TaxID=35762 RepID=UPI001671069F|nr:hypothetical protein [Planobispora rosea]